jgi:iron complex outermembrane receptor protein
MLAWYGNQFLNIAFIRLTLKALHHLVDKWCQQVTGSTDVAKMDKEPQYNEQYEVGVKSEWFDNRLNTQFSVFDIRKNNIRYKPNPDSEPEVWATAGQHQSRGLEFSFIGRVLDNVFVRGGYGYTDAKVKEDNQNPEREGNYLANTSKNTGNLFVRYLPTEQWYTEVGVTYVGLIIQILIIK